MSSWINITEQRTVTLKTKVFLIETKDGNQCIGKIKWYGPWRKYSFFPNPNTVWETDCLGEIVRFINGLMISRKLEKQNSKS